MAHHLAAAAGATAGVQCRRVPSIAHRTQDNRSSASSQHSTSFSRVDLSSSVESDLCCMEDSWDKESPAPAKPCAVSTRVALAQDPQARCGARQTPSKRAQLRRSRPEAPLLGAAASSAAAIRQDSPREERLDSLLKMLSGEDKFRPAGAAGGGRARCHSVSPFVVERRRCFVTWMNKMATFLGYSRDTVAVALNYFDRYTCARPCSPTTAQAVAATALHLAAKFEETNPASLRQLIKYIAVFTPDQLLVMEMSMLKVLNWDLRPATNYDFVRAFCDLLPSASESFSGMPLTLLNKEDEAEETERLRVGAEEIADLSSNEICFVDFLPSTVATATILVSVSLGTSSSPSSSSSTSTRSNSSVTEPEMDVFALDFASSPSSAAASHEDVLQTCVGSAGDYQADASAPADAAAQLRNILECVRLLEYHLAEQYPAISAAASDAAGRVARYAGIVDEPRPRGNANGVGGGSGGGGAKVKVASGAGGASEGAAGLGGRKKVSAVGSVAQAKSRRCSTPTGVEGIVHIEMAAIRNSSVDNGAGPGEGAAGDVGVVDEPAKLCGPAKITGLDKSVMVAAPKAASAAGVGGGDGEGTASQHPRPAPCATRPSGGSFRFSSEDVAFARAAKRKKTRGAEAPSSGPIAPTSGIRTAKTAAAAATMAAATAMTTVVAAPTAAAASATAAAAVVAPAATSMTMTKTAMVQTTSRLTLRGTASVSWQPFSSAPSWRSAKPSGSGGPAGAGVGTLAGSSMLCSRKRSAEALGHCESGSGFGAPVPRVSKTTARDATPVDTAAG